MTGVIVFALILFLLLYLFALNLLLRGSLTPIIEGVLSLLCMAMLVAAFFVFGWKTGIGMILFTLVAVPIAKVLAAPMAYKLLGYRTGYSDFSGMENDAERFRSGRLSLEDYMQRGSQRKHKAKRNLAKLASRPEVRDVLEANGINEDGFLDLYRNLMTHALLDLAWEILGDPVKLQQLITLKRTDAPSHEIFRTFREHR